MGRRALVLGNGESRAGLSLTNFKYDTLIGCNAVYRDLSVDYLVCCDKRVVQEAVNNSVQNIFTRQEWSDKFNVNTLPLLPYNGTDRADDARHWGSGPYAVLLSICLGHREIELVGFDLYGSNNKVNNIYKGTENYSSANSHAIDYSYWVYQIGKLFELFPAVSFTVRNHKGWAVPEDWQKFNVDFVAL
jgi:hypothetical protein